MILPALAGRDDIDVCYLALDRLDRAPLLRLNQSAKGFEVPPEQIPEVPVTRILLRNVLFPLVADEAILLDLNQFGLIFVEEPQAGSGRNRRKHQPYALPAARSGTELLDGRLQRRRLLRLGKPVPV